MLEDLMIDNVYIFKSFIGFFKAQSITLLFMICLFSFTDHDFRFKKSKSQHSSYASFEATRSLQKRKCKFSNVLNPNAFLNFKKKPAVRRTQLLINTTTHQFPCIPTMKSDLDLVI